MEMSTFLRGKNPITHACQNDSKSTDVISHFPHRGYSRKTQCKNQNNKLDFKNPQGVLLYINRVIYDAINNSAPVILINTRISLPV